MRSRAVCRTAAPCCAGAVAEQAAAAPGPSALVRDGDDDLRRGEDRSGQDNLAGYPDPADLVRGRPERPPASPRRLHPGPVRDQDPGERPAPCGRSEYVVRLRRAPRERTPNKPPPHPPWVDSSTAGTTTTTARSRRTTRRRTPPRPRGVRTGPPDTPRARPGLRGSPPPRPGRRPVGQTLLLPGPQPATAQRRLRVLRQDRTRRRKLWSPMARNTAQNPTSTG